MRASKESLTLAWVLLTVAALANAAGYVFGLFDGVAWYDEALHFFTPLALTFLLALLLAGRVLTGRRHHAALLVLVVTLIGVGIGGVWEIGEWAFDHLSGPQNVIQGKMDTLIDLCLDTAGAFVAALMALGALDARG